jgi:predicted transcriptional regulator YdeE
MNTELIENDIHTFYVPAASFPEGIEEAHKKLHSLLPTVQGRQFFGISAPGKDGKIQYKAAVKALEKGEGERLGCESFIIPAGTYFTEEINDWTKDVSQIGKTFQNMLADERIDPNGFCLEVYNNNNRLTCMVKLA